MTRWKLAIALLLLLPLFSCATAKARETFDLDKAVKVGTGRIMVIEFTDPDCPYCRKAEAYFRTRSDVTRYIYFLPLRSHPASKGKVQYILSAPDRQKAYLEVTSGEWEGKKLAEVTPEGIELQEEHVRIARQNKIDVTPTFIVYGRIVEGYDVDQLQKMLK